MKPMSARLEALRQELSRRQLAAVLVPRGDEHLGEYVPPSAERLAWVSGFTGSAGLAIVLPDEASLFTDGRYVTQAGLQLDSAAWTVRHVTQEPPATWLAGRLAGQPGGAVGYDPMLTSDETLQRFIEAGCTMQALADNPVDAVWTDRPAPPASPIVTHDLALAGVASAEKRQALSQTLQAAAQDAVVLSDPASVAWLLNIRATDVAYTPLLLAFALAHADGAVDLFVDPARLSDAVRDWLGNAVRVRPRAELAAALAELAGRRVRVDAAGTPVWFAQQLREAGAEVIAAPDPCLRPKAVKNPVEQEGARTAHRRDAVALCRFLHWLDQEATPQTEWTVAERLLAFRRELDDFRDESFPAIAAAGEHAAIMHYRVDPQAARALHANEIFLIDSGAQFGCGTTDVTRTIWSGPDAAPASLREQVTRVLRGHIAVATLKFPVGTAGVHIDALARRALWDAGLDFDHGTGHGVGSYLSVHEGPVSIGRQSKPVAMEAGMILSDEPGYYRPGSYGIRLENLLLVRSAEGFGERPFLEFETLTLAPFDRALIEPALLDRGERDWLDAYHLRVLHEIGPLLPAATRAWLERACAPCGV